MCELYSLQFQIIGLYLLPPAIDWIYLFISFSFLFRNRTEDKFQVVSVTFFP